ncbi:O-antigen ligase family protein [Brevibacillus composti]|uniref:O-antigen ligase family protein n=1 Tax=Brevibacillus composti TaxID=2796470 RepID=A0A7T5JPX2_9BACL|nr:O-antigen ligase family protein [Brevibacillus composti]QQE75511.1 O-antigen ligase family protein [Brevibacillus composti]QUO42537.1 O-antigen ligase family protein [Brevibacillus composti]
MLAVFLLLLVGSGSRGPLLSLLAVAVLAGPLFYMKKAKQMMSFYLGLLVLGTVMAFSLSWLPPEATARIHSFLEGDLGESELSRLKAYQRSWETIGAHPLGIGWGGFAREINLWPGEARQYPHNIWLEIALEGGWLAAIGFFALVAACFVRLWRRLHSFEARALFALFLYVNLNAMVSGDINDNKLLFALGGMALAAAPDRKQTAPQEGQNDVTNETDRDKGGQKL